MDRAAHFTRRSFAGLHDCSYLYQIFKTATWRCCLSWKLFAARRSAFFFSRVGNRVPPPRHGIFSKRTWYRTDTKNTVILSDAKHSKFVRNPPLDELRTRRSGEIFQILDSSIARENYSRRSVISLERIEKVTYLLTVDSS